MSSLQPNLPKRIQARFESIERELGEILAIANSELKNEIDGAISFQFTSSAPKEVLSKFERAQSVCFIAKYETLPIINKIKITKIGEQYFLDEMAYIRHVLNEYRPIIQNQKDSVHFRKVHAFCFPKLGADPRLGLSILVHHQNGNDVTDQFKVNLGERIRALHKIITSCEFDYIYNGILQHSDHRFTDRFWKEYATGEINYVFLKHAKILEGVRGLLKWHYELIKVLTFPKLGPL